MNLPQSIFQRVMGLRKIDKTNIQSDYFVYLYMNLSIYKLLSCNLPIKKNFNKKIWQNLPHDVLQIILCYHGAMVNRYGKMVGRIPKYDPRYMVLHNIPRIKMISDPPSLIMKVCFSNKKFEMYKYTNDVMYIGNFAECYNFETDTMMCYGKRIDTDVFMFYKSSATVQGLIVRLLLRARRGAYINDYRATIHAVLTVAFEDTMRSFSSSSRGGRTST